VYGRVDWRGASTSIEEPKDEGQDDREHHASDNRDVPPEEELQNHQDEYKDRETAQRTAHNRLRSIDDRGPKRAYDSLCAVPVQGWWQSPDAVLGLVAGEASR
jgi:hypothetical protein